MNMHQWWGAKAAPLFGEMICLDIYHYAPGFSWCPAETHGNLENYLVLLQFVPMLSIIDAHHKRCIRENQPPDATMPALFAEINLSS